MPAPLDEKAVEQIALDLLAGLGWGVAFGPDLAPDGSQPERASYGEVILPQRLRQALARLNPDLPPEARQDAFRKLSRPDSPSLIANNHALHRMLVEGVPVEYRRPDGSVAGAQARVLDFEELAHNDWLAVNQFTVVEEQHQRRPDVVLFVNGLPLVVIELKNPADEQATLWTAFHQLQTYQRQIPALFAYNAVLVVSDGVEARVGTLTAGQEWFLPWRTIAGRELAPPSLPQLQVVLEGVFQPRRFLDLIRYFLVFEDQGKGMLAKKMAGYHQYHAVNVALAETLRASRLPQQIREGRYTSGSQAGGAPGDRRVGVVWHTQGSGKSLTMVFYAGRLILHPEMENPTLVVLTDRIDLDNQLFGTFARCQELLRQPPAQADSRADLRQQLQVASGGVVFTTIQKFFPEEKGDSHPVLSERRNIVVLADEAHRSQYDFLDGFARHLRDALPHASFIGFTGTPVELTDKNTRAVFGEYISVYDLQRAVEDGATVPIYYESRLARLELDEAERPYLDEHFEEVTEGEEVAHQERLKSRWAQLEAVVGAPRRLGLIAQDLVGHFEGRLEGMAGKAMVVCMSRRICVDLYRELVALRPDWHHAQDEQGGLKVVMTGSASDPLEWQPHIRTKARREVLARRFKDPTDPFQVVIVRDLWLTGFDAPCLHTLYVDKPMQGHGLMQAIARVNRVFAGKPGGLVVDYLGLADPLRRALATYTESGGTGQTAIDQGEAVALLLEKYEVCGGLFHGFDRSAWTQGPPAQRLGLLPAAQEHLLAQEEGKSRFLKVAVALSHAFALAVPHEQALALRDDVGFFQAVRAALSKSSGGTDPRSEVELDHALRQLVSRAIAPDQVIDLFAAAGLKKPDLSILSEEFLAEVRGLPHRNLAVELLRQLLQGEIRTRSQRNLVQARSFAQLLERALRRYQNRALETVQVIEELLALASEMRQADQRGAQLGLREEEVAFYDALETNDSAVQVLGDATLRTLARELVQTVRANTSIDWTVKESVRAKLRVMVRRVLRQYGYPPDKQEQATQTVLEQAELLGQDWMG